MLCLLLQKKRGKPKPKTALELRQMLADRQGAREHTSKYHNDLKDILPLLQQDDKTRQVGLGMFRAAGNSYRNTGEVRRLEKLLLRTELEEQSKSQVEAPIPAPIQAKAEAVLQAALDCQSARVRPP